MNKYIVEQQMIYGWDNTWDEKFDTYENAAKELKEFLEDFASEDMAAYENAEFRITKVEVWVKTQGEDPPKNKVRSLKLFR